MICTDGTDGGLKPLNQAEIENKGADDTSYMVIMKYEDGVSSLSKGPTVKICE